MDQIKEVIAKQSDIMIEKYNKLKEINFLEVKEIKINSLKNYNNFDNDFKNLEENIVYLIMTDNKFPFKHECIEKKFKRLKQEKGKYHVSRINDKSFWEKKDKDKILYIGSKEDKAKTRFKQHLGINTARSVYSLYLKDWWPEGKIKINIYQFKPDVDIQIIEDLLWDKYQPLFGKKGSTGNKKQKST